jgi:hypothetical protein
VGDRPVTPHARPVDLSAAFNARRGELAEPLRPTPGDARFGDQVVRGLPFRFGPRDAANVILLEREPVVVALGGEATYVLLVHAVADRPTVYQAGLADEYVDGRSLGDMVSEYALEYADGSAAATPVRRRFGIQQTRVRWGASPFAAVPAGEDIVTRRSSDQVATAGAAAYEFGPGEQQHSSAFDAALGEDDEGGALWLYALPNPHPARALRALRLEPRDEASVVYAISLTELAEHPLRPGLRTSVRLRAPEGARRDALGELTGIAVDLGSALAARPVLRYDHERWRDGEALVDPERDADEVLLEVAAHPAARLHIEREGAPAVVLDLAHLPAGAHIVPPADRPVRLRILDAAGGEAVPVRLHVHGEDGQYLPPRGHHRRVNGGWFEDLYAEHLANEQQYAYVDGDCVVDMPCGTVYVEISRGYEIAPLRRAVEIGPETDVLTFSLERVLRWRERGWVTADTHVHFLSPQTALLEGRAEGVNVVNLLASQWGEMFSNVGDFDGAGTLGSRELGGDGEFLVRVGSENRMQVLGHISLLGYAGRMIHPLCTGGPSESALGDPLEVSMADWAQRCREQGGLVVMPHAPDPQLERAADLVLGLVDAVEMMCFNPLVYEEPVNPYGLADWYRYLNLGYHVPLVAGSDKMSAQMLLGGIRTYAQLGERELTYEAWMDAVRAGDTFVTIGPLLSLDVEGVRPGGRLELPAGGGEVTVSWTVESAAVPVERLEIVAGGLVAEDVTLAGSLKADGQATLRVGESTWIAARVRGSYHEPTEPIAAHTSAVQVIVGDQPLFRAVDAADVLDQIQGALAYVDTIAPRRDVRQLRRIRATLEGAYGQLHARLHAAGSYHRHPLHDPAQPHEH